MSYNFPCGVYGINLTQTLQGPAATDLALLEEIELRYDEVDDYIGGDPSKTPVGQVVYKEFGKRLGVLFAKRRIQIIPPGDGIFRIHRIDGEADTGEEDFAGDLLLGIGILGFPNKIVLPQSFRKAAEWYLWVI